MDAFHSPDVLPPAVADSLRFHRVSRNVRRRPRIYFDTSDFSSIDYGDVIAVDGRYFVVTGYTREGRFGVEEQVKQWVPRVEDLVSGVGHILKLVFHETFEVAVGPFVISCYRNPEKEASILELVRNHPRFMQGYATLDAANNLVRILDVISGSRLDKYIHRGGGSHEEYCFGQLPAILAQFLDCVAAIGLLHEHGFRHGDVRRDHILVEHEGGMFRWIDFDYDFYMPEQPYALDLYELGNLLNYLVGRGDFHPREILADPGLGQRVADTLVEGDFSLLSKMRIVNLRKLFPYIPVKLNNVLLHFSSGAEVFYENVDELLADFGDAVEDLRGRS